MQRIINMLVLSRKTNESIVIDGKIYLDILRFEGDSVKVGVKAPKNVTVYRKEIYDEILESNRAAALAQPKQDIQSILTNKEKMTKIIVMIINTNIQALKTSNILSNESNKMLSQSLARLSSGSGINRLKRRCRGFGRIIPLEGSNQ